MINAEAEKNTFAKQMNLELLEKNSRKLKNKEYIYKKSIFEQFAASRTNYKFPHEEFTEKAKLTNRISNLEKKQILMSPKYEEADVKGKILEKALNEIIQAPANLKKYQSLEISSRKYMHEVKEFRNTVVPLDIQYQMVRKRRALYTNPKISHLTSKYINYYVELGKQN